MNNTILYNTLTTYGDVYDLSFKCNPKTLLDHANNYEYVQYNPRKNIPRKGLSITSLDGEMTGIPDLDSLLTYNQENGTDYRETEFDIPTPVLKESKHLQDFLAPFDGNLFRCHYLKLHPGGYFPPHRDMFGVSLTSFRIIVPLKNVNPPGVMFGFAGKESCYWNEGHMYFFDTYKPHYLVNMSNQDSDWIVLNIKVNEETVKTVTHNLRM